MHDEQGHSAWNGPLFIPVLTNGDVSTILLFPMNLSDYDFDLPQELIAQEPVAQRDQSRLLVLDRGKPGEKYNIGGNNERTNVQVVDAICAAIEEFRPAAENDALRARGRKAYSELKRFVADRPGHDRAAQPDLPWSGDRR